MPDGLPAGVSRADVERHIREKGVTRCPSPSFKAPPTAAEVKAMERRLAELDAAGDLDPSGRKGAIGAHWRDRNTEEYRLAQAKRRRGGRPRKAVSATTTAPAEPPEARKAPETPPEARRAPSHVPAPSARKHGRRPSRDAEIRALVAQGLTAKEIAEQVGFDKSHVLARCRKMGIKARQPAATGSPTNEVLRAEYRRMHGEGLSVAEMAKRRGISRESVRRMLRRMGLPTPNNGNGPDEARRARYRALVDEGKTGREIAAEMGVSFSAVKQMLNKLGLEARRPEPHEVRHNPMRGHRTETLDRLERIRAMHADGYTVADMAAELGIGPSRVYQLLAEAGLRTERAGMGQEPDEAKRQRYRDLHAQGFTTRQIAEEMGVGLRQARQMLTKLRLAPNPSPNTTPTRQPEGNGDQDISVVIEATIEALDKARRGLVAIKRYAESRHG